MENALIFVCITLLLVSCKKDTDMHTVVKGRVLEYGTLKPVGGADVFLTGRDVNCFSCGYNIIAAYKTDADGDFSFDFTGSEGITYDLNVDKARYFAKPNANVNITKGKMNDNRTITLYPEAYIKLIIKNIHPYNSSDYISVNNTFSRGGGGPFYGTQVDTFVIGTVRGNITNSIVWFVTKNEAKSNYSKAVYCPGFDTTIFNINY